MGARIGVNRLAAVLVWLPLVAAATGPASAVLAQQHEASLRGLVTAQDGGAAVPGARVWLDSVAVAVTDDSGGFLIRGVKPAEYRLLVQAVGFQPFEVIVNLAEAKVYMVELALQPGALALEAVTVEALRLPRNRVGEILERMAWGAGDFITRADLDEWRAQETSWALSRSPKVKLNYLSVGECLEEALFGAGGEASVTNQPTTPRRGLPPSALAGSRSLCEDFQGRPTIQVLMGRGFRRCIPSIFLDGIRFQLVGGGQVDDIIDPHDIELIEIYGEFEVPGEFTNADVGCGVIAIWTRSG